MHEMIDHQKTALACIGVTGCATSFMLQAMPYLQFVAVCISIVASVAVIRSHWK